MAKLRFFNAGDKISESLLYSLPDGHDVHCVAHYLVTAPAGGFFEVPTEIEIGPATIRVEFHKDLMNRFGDRGLILIDRNREPENIGEREAVARSDEAAKVKGREMWLDFLRGIVGRHVEQTEQIRAQGGAPLQARGFTKHAFDVLGLEDPAALMARVSSTPTTAPVDQIAALQAQINLLSQQLVASQGAPPEQPSLSIPETGKQK